MGAETPEYMQRVAQYVSRRMEEIEYLGRMGEQRLATLTAINIADELFKAKDDMAALRREMLELQRCPARSGKGKEAVGSRDKGIAPRPRRRPRRVHRAGASSH